MDYIFLQHYWWFIISLLAGILVFLMFVQGGQSVIRCIAKNEEQKSVIINATGMKWEFTFTTLVTFGGAFFASFPLFYSTSFGGAIYVWFAILIFFVLQAVAYEFRSKAGNLLGAKTYEWFLILNGLCGTLLLGTAVGTLFTGADFIVAKANIVDLTGGSNVISSWQNPWHGLEAVTDYRNVALGLAVLFLSRTLGIQYLNNAVDSPEIKSNGKKTFTVSAILFVVFFLVFVISILFSNGLEENTTTGVISVVEYKYAKNMMALPVVTALFVVGVLSVLWSIWMTLKNQSSKAIWFGGAGTVVTVTMLFLLAGYNNTAYYPSLADPQSSLTIANSSSSYFTLKVMSVTSLFIPFVLAYIWYAWKQMNRKKMSSDVVNNGPAY